MSHGRVQVDRLTTASALDALVPEWDVLWRSVADPTPFQSSAWALSWWRVFGRGELRVLAVRRAGRLIGLAPFYLSRNAAGEGQLRILGAGVSDYLDVLSAPGESTPVQRAIESELTATAGEWTFCGFDHLRPESLLLGIAAPPATRDAVFDDEPCPRLALPQGVDDLRHAVGSRTMSNLQRRRRRAEDRGGVSIDAASAGDMDEALEALFTLHGMRWRGRGGPGVLADDHVRAFHRAAAPALLRDGLLRLHAVRIAGRTAAVHYGMRAGSTLFSYLAGFDPDMAVLSPGKLAIAAAMEQGIEEGVSTFDFLGGREAHKYEWQAADAPRRNRHLTRAPAAETAT